ncbi:hypothetical protein D7294_07275 [Streptomyces hoynatensis]|uniref:Glycosyltransferase n=1 Tax=Streptomyces hoynatensis TaxID=1141874 RepID=A0A3A9Z958_9ACTN|nr:hypothetical protein D7294_07275 [Streptomyces hoynatensis]
MEQLEATHLPGFTVPRVFGGHQVGADVRADLAYTLGFLREGGVTTVAGMSVDDALRAVLGSLPGDQVHTFFSYRVAETVRRYGEFEGNPLLAPLTDRQREEIARACDSRGHLEFLATLPRNYAAVLARCETARASLGLPVDEAVLDDLMSRVTAMLTENPDGYLDDSSGRLGRFDIYSIDIYLFAEPLADRLGPVWTKGMRNAFRLAEEVAARNGAAVSWGRSGGALAQCITIELAGLAARTGLVGSRATRSWVSRAEDAFRHLSAWFPGGLIAAHQYRSAESYRGTPRRLQMTLDCLGKLAEAANGLGGATGHRPPAAERDALTWFDEPRRAGVWTYRGRDLAFVLPLVSGSETDYLAVPRNPGLFEVPVNSDLVTGIPFALHDGERYVPAGLPTEVSKPPGGLGITHVGWIPAGHKEMEPHLRVLGGSRHAEYRAEGRTLHVEETLGFDTAPQALAFQVTEPVGRPLDVRLRAGEGDLATCVDTSGLSEYRSYWGELPRTHQIDLTPGTRVRFGWSVTPLLRVLSSCHGHAYDASLYGPLAGRVAAGRLPREVLAGDHRALDSWDQLHVHWPEGMNLPCELDRHLALIEGLREHEVRIVWTQHNLVPHDRSPGWVPIYQAWAAAADAVIHHTPWGMGRARARYRYGAHTRHHVIPHGHFGGLMKDVASVDRRAAERSLGLRPGALRFGVIGAPRAEKRADLAMRAVAASSRQDIELLVLSLAPGQVPPDDPRIVALPYEMVPRAEYNRRLATIDVLIMPFDTGEMLATGTVADAIGLGLPSLVSSWPFLTETLGKAGIPYGDTERELTACLDRLDEETLRSAREAAEALKPHYDWERVAELHFAVLEEVGTAKL